MASGSSKMIVAHPRETMAVACADTRVNSTCTGLPTPSMMTSGRRPSVELSIHGDMGSVEAIWRMFEQVADCTAFQTFEWLATWQKHIGKRNRVRPAIVVGQCVEGEVLFLLPLAIEPKYLATRLAWLGQDLCDYNAPLLAPEFESRITPDHFLALWARIQGLLQHDPRFRHDWIELERMPEVVGAQRNPFGHLDVALNPSGAHLAQLGSDWEAFYAAKRSASRRRRDRAGTRHLAECGRIHFANALDENDAARTLETLMRQKSKSLARMGATEMFARPGYREFFLDLATNPNARHLVHISRLEVGTTSAAATFGLRHGDCYYHVLASYDEGTLARFGPGVAHLRELLQHAIGLGLRRFDFTIGDEPYKREWCDTTQKLYDHVAAATLRGWPAARSSAIRRRLKRVIKQTPVAWRAFTRLRSAAVRYSPADLIRWGAEFSRGDDRCMSREGRSPP